MSSEEKMILRRRVAYDFLAENRERRVSILSMMIRFLFSEVFCLFASCVPLMFICGSKSLCHPMHPQWMITCFRSP